eukprot:11180786-Lingulodinium_polyedra.AAC.1
MFWNVSSDIGGGSPSATDATMPGEMEVSWLTVAVGGGVIRSAPSSMVASVVWNLVWPLSLGTARRACVGAPFRV